jgi:hypothetical protein
MNQRGTGLTLSVLLLAATLPGCHLLVRHGEEPASALQDDEGFDSDVDQFLVDPPELDAPRSNLPLPPIPGLDSESTPPPPLPGLEASGTESLRSPNVLVARRDDSSRQSNHGHNARRDSLDRRQRWEIRRRLSGNTGINTNTAIAPGEGQFVYRTQLRSTRSQSTPTPADIDVNLLVNPQVLAYGLRQDLSLFGVIPLVKRDGTVRPPGGGVTELQDVGVADMRFFAKYRLGEIDEPGETTRISVFAGLEVPSYDKNFSSESWDPFVGTVWTYQSLEWGLDLDWFWNFNTGKGVFRHDEMRYDAAYTYVLLTGQNLDDRFWQLNSIFEINGSYLTDDSHLVYAAPGFQLALEGMIVEASLQLPTIRRIRSGTEPDATIVIGTRITW